MTRPVLRTTVYSALLASVVFWLMFQLSKIPLIQITAPFAEDPYAAVASFGFQIALVVAALSLARFVSIRDEPSLRQWVQYILHGDWLVFACLAVTLVTDFIAMEQARPLNLSAPMGYIVAGLILLTLLTAWLGVYLFRAQREFGNIRFAPAPDALASAISDCWTLAAVIATGVVHHLPFLAPVWKWIDSLAHKTAALWDKKLPFADPAAHPWNFAILFATLLGFATMAVILVSERIKEGAPPSLAIGLLLAGIFFSAETIAILLSFLFFGEFLGLRPKLISKA